MREKSLVSKRWDKGQLEAVKEVSGTVDKTIVEEEVKQYHRNLAVVSYDYKKDCDKVHHFWMLCV